MSCLLSLGIDYPSEGQSSRVSRAPDALRIPKVLIKDMITTESRVLVWGWGELGMGGHSGGLPGPAGQLRL